MTPVIWQKEMLGSNQIIAEVNPLYHFITVIRDPLLNGSFPAQSFAVVGIITIFNFVFASYLYARFKHKLVFWL